MMRIRRATVRVVTVLLLAAAPVVISGGSALASAAAPAAAERPAAAALGPPVGCFTLTGPGLCFNLTRDETRRAALNGAAGGTAVGSLAGQICTKAPSGYGKAACAVGVTVYIVQYLLPIQHAASAGRCVQLKLSLPGFNILDRPTEISCGKRYVPAVPKSTGMIGG